MKTFYASCTVKNTEDNENYNFIIQSKSESSGKKESIKEAIKQFNKDYEEPATSVVVDDFYETSEDARL